MATAFIRTIVLYFLIMIGLRLLGKRQIGELEPIELVLTLLISDLAAVPMQDFGIPLLNGVIPIVTLLSLSMLLSWGSVRSIRLRRLICGSPTALILDGKVQQDAMRHNRFTLDELIEELGAKQIPCLRVYNKSDLYFGDIRPRGEDSVNISAKTGEGVNELLARIDKLLDKGTRRVTIHLPYDKGGLLDMLYREAKVESVEYGETIDIAAVCVPRVIGQVKDYIEGYREPKEDWEE